MESDTQSTQLHFLHIHGKKCDRVVMHQIQSHFIVGTGGAIIILAPVGSKVPQLGAPSAKSGCSAGVHGASPQLEAWISCKLLSMGMHHVLPHLRT